jgi:hypothetical protein
MHRVKSLNAILGLMLAGATAGPLVTQTAGHSTAGHSTAVRSDVPTRWVIDTERSLAWWQVDPNYGHLWATTCPGEPSWQAGEGRSSGYNYKKDPKVSQSEWHSKRIPLWPRDSVRAVCRQAVSGEIAATESRTWRGAHGSVRVRVDSLTMGANMRDKFMHSTILHSGRYPELRFTLDSLVGVVPGDTVRALAWGIFDVHGRQDTVIAPVLVWKDGDGLRVQAKFGVAAKNMIDKYGMSRWALSLGVVLKRWNTLNMGVDLFLRPASQ